MSYPKTKREHDRAGLAAVELAVCLPVLVLILLGCLETCNSIFLKQTATGAAYEAAKICTSVGGTELAARTRVSEILSSSDVEGGTVTFDPPLTDTLVRGTHVSATVNIPSSNTLGGISIIYADTTISARITMVKQ